jgi:hypothetical protein
MTESSDAHTRETKPALVTDNPNAPFIYFELAPALGFNKGVVSITLSANRAWIGPKGPTNEQTVVAHMRGNIQAAVSLRNAIDKALLLAAPTGKAS